ncbi:oxygenase [Lithospermum erythrorhizon]|uniref:Flavin-containing monooxygenase n=1 Tax=Lithospermum erythrorhizon TaxID=34254 RepID=A0AAV3RMF6_LITER
MEGNGVIIVGAGPSGLATAACLKNLSIPYILLDREDCFASLWKKYSYDRLHLHLAKQFCELPHFQFPNDFPKYVSKKMFLQYLDEYVSKFEISPIYCKSVEQVDYDEFDGIKKWRVKARDVNTGLIEEYKGKFLVVATGETCDAFIPQVEGLESFGGEVIHSTKFKNGEKYLNKRVLVVGSGNSGMEIALDLANYGAKTSIVIRSPVHVISREMATMAIAMLKWVPLHIVDNILVMISNIIYGDLSEYGIIGRPQEGPFLSKVKYGKYPIIDVGTFKKIKSGEIQVLPAIASIRGNDVIFNNEKSCPFDAIIFATGFKRSTNKWLKADDLLNEDGLSKKNFPDHWKGKNGLYCVGLARRGLYGAAMDAQLIANDIKAHI